MLASRSYTNDFTLFRGNGNGLVGFCTLQEINLNHMCDSEMCNSNSWMTSWFVMFWWSQSNVIFFKSKFWALFPKAWFCLVLVSTSSKTCVFLNYIKCNALFIFLENILRRQTNKINYVMKKKINLKFLWDALMRCISYIYIITMQ